MGSRVAAPLLLKSWFSSLKLRFLLRLLGIPAALLALHLELHGSSPATSSLILHRLSRRLRLSALSSLLCTLQRNPNASAVNSISPSGRAHVMDRAQPQRKPKSLGRKRSITLDNPDRTSGVSPAFHHPPPPPPSAPQHASAPSDVSVSSTPSTSSSSTLSHPSPAPDMSSHTRSKSHADVVRQGKRLSLQFPIQPAAGSTSPAYSPRGRPQSFAGPSPLASPDVGPSPTETNILAVLAAQERYVLELKEELSKAEQDLKTLKKHWATHESIKQRSELRTKVTQLQPLNTGLANYRPEHDDEDGSTAWMQREMERRKLLLNGTRSSQRKVFSGSKHLRTLSLLSPDKNYSPSFPQPLDSRDDAASAQRHSADDTSIRPPLSRMSTSPVIADQISNTVRTDRYDLGGLSNIQRDALMRTGKQMVGDLKDGFMTFIDDIRQATVGEEAIAGEQGASSATPRPAAKGARKASDGRPTLARAASSKQSASNKTADIGDDFWKEHGLSEPKSSPTNKKTHALKNTHTPQKPAPKTGEDFEDWDSWDTPNDQFVAKTAPSSDDEEDEPTSPVSGKVSSRTSTRYHAKRHDSKASSLTGSSSVGLLEDPKRNPIPWPDLVKLSPTNLKRTASNFMKEMEKNLTPPPESRDLSHSSGDYIGRAASPAGMP